jgi:hypothetical protein
MDSFIKLSSFSFVFLFINFESEVHLRSSLNALRLTRRSIPFERVFRRANLATAPHDASKKKQKPRASPLRVRLFYFFLLTMVLGAAKYAAGGERGKRHPGPSIVQTAEHCVFLEADLTSLLLPSPGPGHGRQCWPRRQRRSPLQIHL